MICLLAPSTLAIYSEEGIPLALTAQGEVQGNVLTFGTYGLTAPPVECTFTLNRSPAYGRVYTGVWGGTERYSGWVDIAVNNQSPIRSSLYGIDDRNEEVFAASHGVYWIAHDATDLLKPGSNTVTVTTSRGEPDNKMDGRVYAVLVVVAEDNGSGPVTRYWITEGNENLHGEGWAGTNPTRKDNATVVLTGADTNGISRANLTILLLATNRGQPDYVLFNGRDLGTPATPAGDYMTGARDIGNERSFDDSGGPGIDTRYVDIESFDVTGMLKNQNTIEFQRGRDLSGDGTITTSGQKSEGEDYIHPCFAMLTVQKPGDSRAPNLSVENLRIENAYTGKEARISGTVWNSGFRITNPVDVMVSVDNVPVKKESVTIDVSGRKEVSATWSAMEGKHAIAIEVSYNGDSNPADNRIAKEVLVGSPPVLSVQIGNPYPVGSKPAPTQTAPLSPFSAIAGLLVIGGMVHKRSQGLIRYSLIGTLFVALIVVGIFVVPGTAASVAGYSIPITISNTGGSDAPPFDITVYLDGEKTTITGVADGLAAGTFKKLVIPLYTTPGSHNIKVVIGGIPGQTAAEGMYEFP